MNLPVYNYKQSLFIPGYIPCTEVYPMRIAIPAFFSLAFVCQIFSYLLPFKVYAYLQLKCFCLAFFIKTECFNNTVQIFTFNYFIIFFSLSLQTSYSISICTIWSCFMLSLHLSFWLITFMILHFLYYVLCQLAQFCLHSFIYSSL